MCCTTMMSHNDIPDMIAYHIMLEYNMIEHTEI